MILVIGIGNIIFGDDAAGVYVLRELKKRFVTSESVKFIEGETDVYYCVDCIQKIAKKDKVLIIDSCDFEKECGTVFVEKLELYDKYLDSKIESHSDSLIKIMRREFREIDGFVINIQIHDAQFRVGLSKELSYAFDSICSDVASFIEEIIRESVMNA